MPSCLPAPGQPCGFPCSCARPAAGAAGEAVGWRPCGLRTTACRRGLPESFHWRRQRPGVPPACGGSGALVLSGTWTFLDPRSHRLCMVCLVPEQEQDLVFSLQGDPRWLCVMCADEADWINLLRHRASELMHSGCHLRLLVADETSTWVLLRSGPGRSQAKNGSVIEGGDGGKLGGTPSALLAPPALFLFPLCLSLSLSLSRHLQSSIGLTAHAWPPQRYALGHRRERFTEAWAALLVSGGGQLVSDGLSGRPGTLHLSLRSSWAFAAPRFA